MDERVGYDDDGYLDEIVTSGGTHLERLDDERWFLNCIRADGSEVCVWIDGKVSLIEERPAPEARNVDFARIE